MSLRGFLIVTSALLAATAGAASLRQVEGVELKGDGADAAMAITTDKPANFTSFKLTRPTRIVVDFPETTANPQKREAPEGGLVTRWSVEALGDDAAPTARLVVEVSGDADYTLAADGRTVALKLRPATGRPMVALASDAATPVNAVAKPDEAEAAKAREELMKQLARGEAEAAEREKAARAALEKSEKERIAREAQEKAENERNTKAEAAKAEAEAAQVAKLAAEKAAREASAEKAEKQRVAKLEAEKAAREAKERAIAEKAEKQRLAKAEAERAAREAQERAAAAAKEKAEKQRLAKAEAEKAAREGKERAAAAAKEKAEKQRLAKLEAEKAAREAKERAVAAAREQAEKRRLAKLEAERLAAERTRAAAARKLAKADAEKAAARERAEKQRVSKTEMQARAALTGIGFQRTAGGARVTIRTSHAVAFSMREAASDACVLDLEATHIGVANNRRPLDTRYFGTSVARVLPREDPAGGRVSIELELTNPASCEAHAAGGAIVVDVSGDPAALHAAVPAEGSP